MMADSPSNPPTKAARGGAAAAFLLILALATYANTFSARYAWDDVSSFLFHEHVQDPSKFFQLFKEDQHAFGRGQGNFYRPMVSVSFMVDYIVSAPSAIDADEPAPLFFHVHSALWHALATLGLFALLRRIHAAPGIALIVAAVFAVHPLHTEAIAYVSGRADSMSAAFMFWSLVLALSPSSGSRRWAAVAGALALFVCALLSKESSAIYPALLLVALWITSGASAEDERPYRLAALGGSAAILGIYAVLRSTVLRFASAGGGVEVPLGQRLTEAVQAFARYVELLFYPTDLHMQRNTIEGATWLTSLAGVVLLLGAVFFIVAMIAHKQRRAAGGMIWFLAAWFPISGVFTLNAPMAEHWMYVPMAGFWWALAELLPRTDHPLPALRRPGFLKPAGAVIALWLLLLLSISAERNLDWRSSEAIFRATLEDNPESSMVHFNLALTYEGPLENTPGARRHYEELLALFDDWREQGTITGYPPEEVEARYSLANLAYLEHDIFKAAWYYEQLVKEVPMSESAKPLIARAAFQLGKIYLQAGQRDAGLQYIQRAVAVDPDLQSELPALGIRLQ